MLRTIAKFFRELVTSEWVKEGASNAAGQILVVIAVLLFAAFLALIFYGCSVVVSIFIPNPVSMHDQFSHLITTIVMFFATLYILGAIPKLMYEVRAAWQRAND